MNCCILVISIKSCEPLHFGPSRTGDEKVSSSVGSGNSHPRADIPSGSSGVSEFSAGALLGGLLILLGAVAMTGLVLRCAAIRKTRTRRERREGISSQESEHHETGDARGTKSSLVVRADGGGGSITTRRSLMFIPPPPAIPGIIHEEVAERMLQRMPPGNLHII